MTAPVVGFSAFASLKVRNYRLQWCADLLTSWAFEIETLLLSWYVLTQSNSVFLMAGIGSLAFAGTLFAPLFGVAGDRIGLRNLLCLMRALYAFNAIVLLSCALAGQLTVTLAFVIAAATGLVRPSDLGVRTALVANTVSAGILPSAIGLSRTTFDSARVFAALSGAGLFAAFGIGVAYILVAACYLIGLALTVAIKPPASCASEPQAVVMALPATSPFRDLMEGVAYIWRTPPIRAAMILACLVNFTAFPFCLGLVPYLARDVLGGDEILLGYLMASFASGSLVGSIVIMLWQTLRHPARTMIVFAVVWHAFLAGLALSDTPWMAQVMLFGTGIAQSLSMVPLSLMIMQTSEPRLRGRVMGVRMMAIYSLPIGLMCAGWLIPQFGFTATALTYVLTGLVASAVIGIIWRRHLWDEPAALRQAGP